MGPYSHYVLAAKLARRLKPAQPAEYYWGSIIPDIRYLAQQRRDHTHVERERMQQWAACYPQLKSFILGYQVHCLIDQIDVSQIINKAFPFNVLRRVLRKDFSNQQLTMLVEMVYLQSAAPGGELAGNHNAILDELGITPDQTARYYQGMQIYLGAHSLDAAITAYQQIWMIENARLEKYFALYRSIKNRKLIHAMMILSVKNARLDQKVYSLAEKTNFIR